MFMLFRIGGPSTTPGDFENMITFFFILVSLSLITVMLNLMVDRIKNNLKKATKIKSVTHKEEIAIRVDQAANAFHT